MELRRHKNIFRVLPYRLTVSDLLEIYPNPSKGLFILSDQQTVFSDQIVTVSNVLGEMVYSTRITDQKISIDVSAAKDGIYFVTISSYYGKLVAKIVKE